jgi:ABC-type lipoprotein export system ATPase subunit
MGSMLELSDVAKRYRRGREDVVALAGVDLEVGPGEFVAVTGASGSGKSTLLHLAGGLDTADRGQVSVGGRPIGGLTAKQRAELRRRRIGFVFQFFHLLPSLTVAENVALPLLLDGRRDAAAVDDVIDRVGLSGRRHHAPAQLSGGEMQRAAIARALVAGPELILADEPTGNLDSANGKAILALLAEQVAEAGAALLLVTHDRAAARRADRNVTLKDGMLN